MNYCDRDEEYCVTCKYWSGEREADRRYDRVTFDNRAVGICHNKKGREGKEQKPKDSCRYWQIWTALEQ